MKSLNFSLHLTMVFVVTVLCALIYVTVQQSHRATANDPQLQIARDLKTSIENNHPWVKSMTDDSVEISQSLAVFKTLYGKNGEPVQSNGFLDGHLPQLPHGVFDFTSAHHEDVLTWQPKYGVRMAMVVEAVNSHQIGFVAVGRSLLEIEKRESNLRTMVFVAWLVCTGIIILHFLLTGFSQKKQTI